MFVNREKDKRSVVSNVEKKKNFFFPNFFLILPWIVEYSLNSYKIFYPHQPPYYRTSFLRRDK